MKTLYQSTKQLNLYYAAKKATYMSRIAVKTDGTSLSFSVKPWRNSSSNYSTALELTVVYNGESRTMSWTAFNAEQTVTFPYSDGVRSLTISGADVTYGGVSYGGTYTVAWAGGAADPDPVVTLNLPPHFRETYTSVLSWNVSDPLGRAWRVLGICVNGSSSWQSRIYHYIQAESVYTNESYSYTPINEYAEAATDVRPFNGSDVVSIEVMIGVYASSDTSGENYVGFCSAETPLYQIGYNNEPAPALVTSISSTKRGEPCVIEWESNECPEFPFSSWNYFYELKYYTNGAFQPTVTVSRDEQYSEKTYTLNHASDVTRFRLAITVCAQPKQGGTVWVSYVHSTPWIDLFSSNIYVSYGGEIRDCKALYIGRNGVTEEVNAMLSVGS